VGPRAILDMGENRIYSDITFLKSQNHKHKWCSACDEEALRGKYFQLRNSNF